jgi:hypothetical protein
VQQPPTFVSVEQVQKALETFPRLKTPARRSEY